MKMKYYAKDFIISARVNLERIAILLAAYPEKSQRDTLINALAVIDNRAYDVLERLRKELNVKN
jgi:hypothetical protein